MGAHYKQSKVERGIDLYINDNDYIKNWYVVKCTENDKLKAKLKEYFRKKYNVCCNGENKRLDRYLIIDKNEKMIDSFEYRGLVQYTIDLKLSDVKKQIQKSRIKLRCYYCHYFSNECN